MSSSSAFFFLGVPKQDEMLLTTDQFISKHRKKLSFVKRSYSKYSKIVQQ